MSAGEGQRLEASKEIASHLHREAYAAIVLAGSYEEFGDRGRLHAREGDVILHGGFESHRNLVGRRGARILNLRLPWGMELGAALVNSDQLDEIVRAYRGDEGAAGRMMLASAKAVAASPRIEPADDLAACLGDDPSLKIVTWAKERGIDRFRLARAFHARYGISAAGYRVRLKSRLAWRKSFEQKEALAEIALEAGFFDQAHMSKAVKRLTGRPPAQWRAHIFTREHKEA